jgi:hypothetical protein
MSPLTRSPVVDGAYGWSGGGDRGDALVDGGVERLEDRDRAREALGADGDLEGDAAAELRAVDERGLVAAAELGAEGGEGEDDGGLVARIDLRGRRFGRGRAHAGVAGEAGALAEGGGLVGRERVGGGAAGGGEPAEAGLDAEVEGAGGVPLGRHRRTRARSASSAQPRGAGELAGAGDVGEGAARIPEVAERGGDLEACRGLAAIAAVDEGLEGVTRRRRREVGHAGSTRAEARERCEQGEGATSAGDEETRLRAAAERDPWGAGRHAPTIAQALEMCARGDARGAARASQQ